MVGWEWIGQWGGGGGVSGGREVGGGGGSVAVGVEVCCSGGGVIEVLVKGSVSWGRRVQWGWGRRVGVLRVEGLV